MIVARRRPVYYLPSVSMGARHAPETRKLSRRFATDVTVSRARVERILYDRDKLRPAKSYDSWRDCERFDVPRNIKGTALGVERVAKYFTRREFQD